MKKGGACGSWSTGKILLAACGSSYGMAKSPNFVCLLGYKENVFRSLNWDPLGLRALMVE